MIDWLAMIVASVASTTSGTWSGARTQDEERIGVDRNRAFHDRGGLPSIVEEQHGKDKPIPGEADRPRPEMSHVGIERFGAGGAQEHRAENQEAGEAVAEQIGKAIARIERDQHAGMLASRRKPSTPIVTNHIVMIGPNSFADRALPCGCSANIADQNGHRERHHIGRDRRRRQFQALRARSTPRSPA